MTLVFHHITENITTCFHGHLEKQTVHTLKPCFCTQLKHVLSRLLTFTDTVGQCHNTCHIRSTKVYALSRFSWCSGEVLFSMTASSVCARTRQSRQRTSFRLDKVCVNNKPWTSTGDSQFTELKSLLSNSSSRGKIYK